MLKVLFNQDGSIGGFQFPNFVTQGSHGTESTKIAVAVDGDFNIYDPNLSIVAKFRLPNGEYNETVFESNPEPETFELVGRTYNCRSIYLTELQTVFAGVLFISIVIKNITTQETLYTYQCKIMIDPSTYSIDGRFEVVSYDNLAQQVLWLYNNVLTAETAVMKVDDVNIVYGTNLSGEEYHIAYSFNVTGLSLVQRDSNGQVLVPETPTANNNAASKKYVDDVKQEIKDIAESRIKNWILSYDETIATVKTACQLTNVKFYLLNSSGEFEDKKAELLNGDYDNLTIANNIFNSNYQTAGFQNDTYLIFKNIGYAVGVPSNDYEFYMVSRANFGLVSGPIGSNVYVTNTDVPDRWISYIQSYGSPTIFSALESKTNLSNYPTKTEMDTAISEAQLGGTASFDQLPTENSQNAVTSGGVYQALHNILFMHNNVSIVIPTTLPVGSITIALANPIISNKSTAPQTLSSLGQLISNYLIDSGKCEVDVTGTIEVSGAITGTIKKFGYYLSTDTPYVILDGSSTEISLTDHRSTQATSSTDYIATIL